MAELHAQISQLDNSPQFSYSFNDEESTQTEKNLTHVPQSRNSVEMLRHYISVETAKVLQNFFKKTTRNQEKITKDKVEKINPKNFPHYQIERIIFSIIKNSLFFGFYKILLESQKTKYKKAMLENINDRYRQSIMLITGKHFNIWKKVAKTKKSLKFKLRATVREILFFILEKMENERKIAFKAIYDEARKKIIEEEKMKTYKNSICKSIFILQKIFVKKEIIFKNQVIRIIGRRIEIVNYMKGLFFLEKAFRKKYFKTLILNLCPRYEAGKRLSTIFKKLKIIIKLNKAIAFYKLASFSMLL